MQCLRRIDGKCGSLTVFRAPRAWKPVERCHDLPVAEGAPLTETSGQIAGGLIEPPNKKFNPARAPERVQPTRGAVAGQTSGKRRKERGVESPYYRGLRPKQLDAAWPQCGEIRCLRLRDAASFVEMEIGREERAACNGFAETASGQG